MNRASATTLMISKWSRPRLSRRRTIRSTSWHKGPRSNIWTRRRFLRSAWLSRGKIRSYWSQRLTTTWISTWLRGLLRQLMESMLYQEWGLWRENKIRNFQLNKVMLETWRGLRRPTGLTTATTLWSTRTKFSSTQYLWSYWSSQPSTPLVWPRVDRLSNQ